jgi:cytoskeletal protein RodZ
MKRIVTLFMLCTGIAINTSAQTFTQRIQQQNSNGQGTITIHEDENISKLVNSEVLNNTKQPTQSNVSTPNASTVGKNTSTTKPTTPTTKPTVINGISTGDNSETDEANPDLSKKVMRGGVKVNGYRVQAFAGGNSRKDRVQAEQIGNNIKSHFANVPVYVHFYSPRWICRVGNYRTYEEAHQMLVQLRNLGYNQASIVKGKITVQY